MSYTPINWQTGDTITAEKLNKMDNGWSVESTQPFSETVTTERESQYAPYATGVFAHSQLINSGTITVTFNSVSYICNRIDYAGYIYYGGV